MKEYHMTDESLRQQEESLRERIGHLTVEQKKRYYALELAQVKDPDTYAALNWAFLAGLHHFYLGKIQRGLFNLIFMLVGGVFYFSQLLPLVGGAMIVSVFLLELPQLFNSQKIIHQYNNDVMKRSLSQVDG